MWAPMNYHIKGDMLRGHVSTLSAIAGYCSVEQKVHLVVDDVPCVRDSGIVLSGKGMVADTRGSEGIAGHIHGLQTWAVPSNVKGS